MLRYETQGEANEAFMVGDLLILKHYVERKTVTNVAQLQLSFYLFKSLPGNGFGIRNAKMKEYFVVEKIGHRWEEYEWRAFVCM